MLQSHLDDNLVDKRLLASHLVFHIRIITGRDVDTQIAQLFDTLLRDHCVYWQVHNMSCEPQSVRTSLVLWLRDRLTSLRLWHKLDLCSSSVAVYAVETSELTELAFVGNGYGHEPSRSILTDGASWYENAVICHSLIRVSVVLYLLIMFFATIVESSEVQVSQ